MAELHISIRDYMKPFIGHVVLDVTQHDDDADLSDPTGTFVEFLFDNGGTARFFTQPDTIGPAFMLVHPDDCNCGVCEEEDNDD